MDILVIGGGGREHAICYALKKSPKVKNLYAIPGNAGISEIAECHNISVMDFNGILDYLNFFPIRRRLTGFPFLRIWTVRLCQQCLDTGRVGHVE